MTENEPIPSSADQSCIIRQLDWKDVDRMTRFLEKILESDGMPYKMIREKLADRLADWQGGMLPNYGYFQDGNLQLLFRLVENHPFIDSHIADIEVAYPQGFDDPEKFKELLAYALHQARSIKYLGVELRVGSDLEACRESGLIEHLGFENQAHTETHYWTYYVMLVDPKNQIGFEDYQRRITD